VVLVDTGVGGPGAPGASWIGTPGRLPGELAGAGVDPDEVDLVVLTHLHLDHIGWNLAWDAGRPRPRFGGARYLVQRADWERFAREGDDDDRAAFERCVRPLRDLGALELLDGDRALSAELSLLHTPGHTPGSQSLLVRSGGAALLLWGDAANHPAQVDQPAWGPGSDLQPAAARATRRRLLGLLEAEGAWLGPAHFPEPFGTVAGDGEGRHWRPRR
jgi:glyoxylase-like metal-dependent hydrolase (beta-lactamase superfamily II)